MAYHHVLSALTKLQQLILRSYDIDKVLDRLLPAALEQLSALGFTYHFTTAVFIDESYKIKQSYFTEAHPKEKKSSVTEIIKFDELFNDRGFLKELLWGEFLTTDDIDVLISSSYHDFVHLKSVTIIPIYIVKNLVGVFILGSPRLKKQTTPEELGVVDIVANQIGLIHRLQETQNSLREVTQEVYKMNRQLHELDRLKDDFVSITSHELRTPMTAIRSYAWMVLNRPDAALSEKMKKYMVRILISAGRLINLVNDMLNISRIESGRIEISPEPIDLIVLCRDIVDEIYYSKSTTKNVHFHLLEQTIPKVFADPNKLRQVFLNIMGNALKFSPPAGNITIGFFTDGVTVETYIKDEGPGIAQQDRGRLFTKFGRLDNSYTASAASGGTGLGLYISKALIDLMHGKIWVESEGLGKGATFKFSLPIATEEVLKHADEYKVKPHGEVKELEPAAI